MKYAQFAMLIASSSLLVSTLDAFAAVTRAQRATGCTSVQPVIAATIFVKPDGSDNADGSSVQNAVKTVAKGIALAGSRLQQGTATKIQIYPGTYREGGMRINGDQIGGSAKSTPLVIEGTEKGKVIISGSVSAGWEPGAWKLVDSAKFIYEHSWPYAWPISGLPPNETANWYTELLRHRELLFYNGLVLRQFLSYANLTSSKFSISPTSLFGRIIGGRFFVNDTTNKVYIQIPAAFASGDQIEVAEKGILLWLEPKNNVVLRNITFTHSNDYIWQNGAWGVAVRFTARGSNNLIEDCDFSYNNAAGGDLYQAQATTYRRCTFSSNGWRGMGLGTVDNVLIESCRTDSNSWRQYWAGHTGLDAGGIKCGISSRITVYKFGSVGGTSEALWFDCSNTHITFDQCTIPQVHPSPMMLEANPGPFTIVKCVVSGVAPIGTSNVMYDSCEFKTSIGISDQNFRVVGGWTAVNQNYGVYHCTITINGPAYTWDQNSLDPQIWSRFFGTLESDYNTWKWDTRYSYPGDKLFRDPNKNAISFAQWQALGKDVHSVFLNQTPALPGAPHYRGKPVAAEQSTALLYGIDGKAIGPASMLRAKGSVFSEGIYLTAVPGRAAQRIVIHGRAARAPFLPKH